VWEDVFQSGGENHTPSPLKQIERDQISLLFWTPNSAFSASAEARGLGRGAGSVRMGQRISAEGCYVCQ